MGSAILLTVKSPLCTIEVWYLCFHILLRFHRSFAKSIATVKWTYSKWAMFFHYFHCVNITISQCCSNQWWNNPSTNHHPWSISSPLPILITGIREPIMFVLSPWNSILQLPPHFPGTMEILPSARLPTMYYVRIKVHLLHHYCLSLTHWGQKKMAAVLQTAFSLTHTGRGKIAAVSQMTLSDAFSWMKMYECWLKFHWNLFLRFQLTIFQHWFR